MTLYPLGQTTVDELFDVAQPLIATVAPDFGVARNVHGVEVRPVGIDKGSGTRRIANLLELPLETFAGVGDSDPDLSYLELVGLSAAPANGSPAVRRAVDYVAIEPFGKGLLEIVTLVERRNCQQSLTER